MSSGNAHIIATREAYERYAEAYAHHRSDRSSIRPYVEQFVALLPGGAALLDVGCGSEVDTGSLALLKTAGFEPMPAVESVDNLSASKFWFNVYAVRP